MRKARRKGFPIELDLKQGVAAAADLLEPRDWFRVFGACFETPPELVGKRLTAEQWKAIEAAWRKKLALAIGLTAAEVRRAIAPAGHPPARSGRRSRSK